MSDSHPTVDSQKPVDVPPTVEQADQFITTRLSAVSEALESLQDEAATDESPSEDLILEQSQAPMAQTVPVPQLDIDQISSPDGEPEEEGSIEQYMADLLARNGGAAATVSMSSQTAPTPAAKVGQAQRTETPPPKEEPNLEEMAERRRQQTQSEVRNNLSTMREVANLNTRNAIETHSAKQMVQQAFARVLMIVLGLGMSFFLLRSVTSYGSLHFASAAAGSILAIFGATQYFRITSNLKRHLKLRQTT